VKTIPAGYGYYTPVGVRQQAAWLMLLWNVVSGFMIGSGLKAALFTTPD
jgi:hypothetical protein